MCLSTSRLSNDPGSRVSLKDNPSLSILSRAERGRKPRGFAWSSWSKGSGGPGVFSLPSSLNITPREFGPASDPLNFNPQRGEEFRCLSQTLPGLQRGEIEGMGIKLSFFACGPPHLRPRQMAYQTVPTVLIVTSVLRQINRGCPGPSTIPKSSGFGSALSCACLHLDCRRSLGGQQPSRSLQFIAHLTVLGR